MGREIIDRKITIEDVKKFNEILPEVIEIYSTKEQDIEILSQLNPKILIRVIGENNLENDEVSLSSKTYYTPQQLCSVIQVFEEYEKGLKANPKWNDLEKSLYIYSRLALEYKPIVSEQDKENLSSSLLSLFTLSPNSVGFATIYKEAMDRIGIPCKFMENIDHTHAWNEIMINGKYYPVDLEMDSNESHAKGPGNIFVHNFSKNKEFYFLPEHKTSQLTENELKEIRALEPELIQKTLDTVIEQIKLDQKSLQARIESVKIPLHSKELSGLFKDNTVSLEEAIETKDIKVKLTDENFEDLKEDLKEIGIHYPNLLSNIELENTTTSKINMQEVIDLIYSVKYADEKSKEEKSLEQSFSQLPINITISSSFEEDFDLDFSKVPAAVYNSNTPTDSEKEGQKITLKNLNKTDSIKLPSLKGKISPNIDGLALEGFDLQNLDLTDTNIQKLSFKSELTKNIDLIAGTHDIFAISLEALNAHELAAALTNFSVHDLTIRNQNLHDRDIFNELSSNPNLARIGIVNSNLNKLDGLELFNSRLSFLNLQVNDLTLSDLERLNDFKRNNPYVEMYSNNNHNIRDAIQHAPEISDESYNSIRDYFSIARGHNFINNKLEAVDRLLWNDFNFPYYIKDAEIIRRDLKITHNPMMVENDTELETFDFDKDFLRDGTLLLTISQAEKLLQLGKNVPQEIRLKIDDVTDLSSRDAIDLYTRMNNAGMNISGVQIFDKNKHNGVTQITPYSLSQYVYIRDTLDMVTEGIEPSDSDIDKFATIYQRFMDFIKYDYDAIKHSTTAESIYYAEKMNTSRNLLEGLEEGKCVCAGYADILKNALALVGIEARYNAGLCKRTDNNSGHAWNQVQLDDGTGNKKWYYTDLTWDAARTDNRYTLLGSNNTEFKNSHQLTKTQNIENVTPEDYDRNLLREAFRKAKTKSFNFKDREITIDIPEDPNIPIEVLDQTKIADEYKRRKDDMYAKFYGDKEYKKEYSDRSKRFREHEIERTEGTITYKTIEDYPEREDDEKFLLLDKYSECLERMSRYEAGDISVYQGTPDQINKALEKDKVYVETRNHTFNQVKNTRGDLATLGKYGERVPYIPKQQGVLKNIVRAVGNVGIFTRNVVSPVYRVIGRYVAQPVHRLVMGDRDASPFKNNLYHRMVSRRDYFEYKNNTQNPGHGLINGIKSRFEAIFKASEGNEAVLRAGAADIRENIVEQEREKIVLRNLSTRNSLLEEQIRILEQEINFRTGAPNLDIAKQALQDKIAKKANLEKLIEKTKNNTIGMAQTDAISDTQHSIASKEVNTMKVTVIKGVAKGIAVKYVGPKIHEWLAERGKTTRPIQITTQVEETKQRWVEPTYKTETIPVYDKALDTSKNMRDIISANKGKDITGFYSVYGGEHGVATYKLTGNENITAIFQAKGNGGVGLADKVGLTAPTLTSGSFDSNLLDVNGLLNQKTTLTQLVDALNTGKIEAGSLENLYVSIGDKYWTKLSDLTKDLTTQVQVGEEIKKVIDVAGHYENYTETVEKIINTTEVITNPALEKTVNIASNVGEGGIMIDGILDVAENLRKTTTDVKSNKKKPRKYTFNEDVDDIPKSKKEYRQNRNDDGR